MPRLLQVSTLVLVLACLPPALAGGQSADAPLPPDRVSLESIRVSGTEDVERLERLGFDVTHDVSPTDATVALYSDVERSRLDAAGFSSRTLIPDLQEKSAADRAAEDDIAIPTALPSGRSTYRVYEDYLNEMDQLADENPDIVRKLTIGQSIEGRDIIGLEIASEVNRTDDGRPAYVQMGLHHAREWPSGEFPIEFAIDLVNGYNASDAEITGLLDDVRVFIFPVINPDGYIASRGSAPSAGGAPVIVGGFNEFRRKNCRPDPNNPADASLPCSLRPNSGVDLNRNYGYYWGGPGASTSTTSESYRGTTPFSEPESEAVHQLSSGIHPTVFISNHTFTDTGWWLRQPGFDAPFLPQAFDADKGAPGATTFDEPAMKALGDAMGDDGADNPALGATGWPSDLGWKLGDITGATEDWNYFAQGSYGYTPEARGLDFHSLYSDMVIEEYEGDASHVGEGVREAYLIAGAEAADPDNHGVISGTVPPGATLRLRKEFGAPRHPNNGGPPTAEVLESTLVGPADGTYEWHVNPSSRPDTEDGAGRTPPLETWTMTCERPGQGTFGPRQVSVDRNQVMTEDWGTLCGVDAPGNILPVANFDFTPAAPEVGQQVNFVSTSTDADGAIAPENTKWDLDDDGMFDDATGLTANSMFNSVGAFEVSVEVTDNDGGLDTETKIVNVSAPANTPPAAGFNFTPTSPAVGQEVVFNSTSTDSDGDIDELAWDFDADGQFDDALGGQVTRAFTAAGTYPVSLRATDDDDTSDTDTQSVVVGGLAQGTPAVAPSPAVPCRKLTPTIVGTAGDDMLRGTPGADVIAPLAGDDRVSGLGGGDTVCGSLGDDRINGGSGGDTLMGNKGDDRINGGSGGDLLGGGQGDDRVSGGAGRDRCNAGSGGGTLSRCP